MDTFNPFVQFCLHLWRKMHIVLQKLNLTIKLIKDRCIWTFLGQKETEQFYNRYFTCSSIKSGQLDKFQYKKGIGNRTLFLSSIQQLSFSLSILLSSANPSTEMKIII